MINHEDRFICNRQKELFEYAQSHYANIKIFTHDFLCSDFCNRSLDQPYSVDQFADIMNWLEFLEKDCKIKPDPLQKERLPKIVAGWLGFVYRQLQIETGLKSRVLADKIPFERLVIAYPGLHTVDEDMATDIICHDFGLQKLARD